MDSHALKIMQNDISEIKGSISTMAQNLATVKADIASIKAQNTIRNGRLEKVEDKIEKGLVEDARITTEFKQHSKADDVRFGGLDKKMDEIIWDVKEIKKATDTNTISGAKTWLIVVVAGALLMAALSPLFNRLWSVVL